MEALNYEEFEKLLFSMREEIMSNIEQLREELDSITAEDEIDDIEDMSSLISDNDSHIALLEQQQNELDEVNHALFKIKNRNYGICEASGKKIPLERLRAEPHTRYTLEEAKKAELR